MIELSRFDNSWYSPGKSRAAQALWFFLGAPLLRSSFIPFAGFRRRVLRLFGARIGANVIIKPGVRVKYPWRLFLGDHSWVGEDCWIDNLADVTIGSNVCISQGAYLCTGNHDWSDPAFGLIVRPIVVCDGAWICARAVIGPGVTIGEGAVASTGSVITKDIPPYEIHAGNPARLVRRRVLRGKDSPSVRGSCETRVTDGEAP